MEGDVCISGEVSTGLGRAHIFMAQAHYQEQFKQVLGATAWPGTLNVSVQGDDLIQYIAMRDLAGVDTLGISAEVREAADSVDTTSIVNHRIRGFLRDGVSFGGATAIPAWISVPDGEPSACAILIPDLTRHTDVVEVISSSFLREAHDLVDDSVVILSLA